MANSVMTDSIKSHKRAKWKGDEEKKGQNKRYRKKKQSEQRKNIESLK